MTAREEVTGAVERFRARREEYADTSRESGAANRQRWNTLRSVPGHRREGALTDADARGAVTDAAADAAFVALGKALVEMYSLAGMQAPKSRNEDRTAKRVNEAVKSSVKGE